MILDEYALIPDIFNPASYSQPGLATLLLPFLKEPLLNGALVRDLRDGEWSAFMKQGFSHWDRIGKELLTKLIKQNRLCVCPPAGSDTCSNGEAWLVEAIASHDVSPLRGIICPDPLATAYKDLGLVGSIEKLQSASWWSSRSASIETSRKMDEYKRVLTPVLRNANSLIFIDPHLDPSQQRYSQFVELIEVASQQRIKPDIEIHRVCYTGSGPQRQFLGNTEWERLFITHFGERLKAADITAKVFIWPNFHDRFLITNLVGISLTNGFDTSNDSNASVTWSRLGRDLRDQKQREFDSACRHPKHVFTLGDH